MVAVIYVARHGLRANHEPSPTGIDGDVRLTAEGELQARELATYLAGLGGSDGPDGPGSNSKIDAIYCSPFYRCLQSVTPTSERLGDMPIRVETGIGEYYHVNRPTHPVPLPAAASRAVFPNIDPAYTPQVPVSPAGETLESLRERVAAAVAAIMAHADAEGFATILIMTHAAIKIKLSEVLTGTTVRAGTCSLDKHENVGGRFVTVVNGLTDFLSGGEQMHWSFDMAYEAGSAADEASRADPHSESVVRSDPAVPKDPTVGAVAAAQPPSSEAMARVYVPLDTSSLPPDAQPDAATPASSVEVDRLESDRPLAKIGSQLYEGQWSQVLGTELYASPEGEPVGQAKYRVQLQPVEVQPETQQRKKLADRLKDVDREKGREQ